MRDVYEVLCTYTCALSFYVLSGYTQANGVINWTVFFIIMSPRLLFRLWISGVVYSDSISNVLLRNKFRVVFVEFLADGGCRLTRRMSIRGRWALVNNEATICT